MKTLSIIILSYNVKQLILDCIKSIPRHSDWEIIVVDNGSKDGSVAAIRSQFPNVEIIENKENLGFAAGNNVALKQTTTPYVLLLNPDTLVFPKTIETVLEFVQRNPGVGAATCRVELPDGSLDYSCHRGFPNPINSLWHFLGFRSASSYSSTKVPNYEHQIEALTGAFALIRKSAGTQVGWLDEDYYWNGEDLDFCYKLHTFGWKVMFIPQVKIIHYKGSSAKASHSSRLAWATNSTDVMKIFYRKHLSQRYPFFVNWAVLLGIWTLKQIRSFKA